ncbi:hypothetical protein [Zavarzinella formosa]|uniref:hypothetical protein n=1 Tax=Zavarzinella formosa TaxID=360055 RepID=UPI0002ED49C6|nr:hypothetical protein [Zavarzinella formosa]
MPVLRDGIILPDHLELLERHGGKVALGQLAPLSRDVAKLELKVKWWNEVPGRTKKDLRSERDSTWDWVVMLGEIRQRGSRGHAWGVFTDDGKCQGAIIYETGLVSALDESQATVVCWRIASAPKNRSHLCNGFGYRGVGTGLIKLACLHSHLAGLGGRLTLDGHKGDRALGWYLNLGFQEVSNPEDDIIELELSPESARSLLSKLPGVS